MKKACIRADAGFTFLLSVIDQFGQLYGIVTKGVENTIDNVRNVARDGMKDTNREITEIMLRR